jgi:hypothetical protein
MAEPVEGQSVIITHNKDRPDREIVVNGPFKGENFIEKIADVSKEARWQQPIPAQAFETAPGKQPTRDDVLAYVTSILIGKLEESIFIDFSIRGLQFRQGSRIWANSSYHIIVGNVTDFDLPGDTRSENEETESDKEGEEDTESEDSDSESEDEEFEVQPAGGGFIYPAVWVDEPPERSFEQKVWGSNFRENEVVYQMKYLETTS